jgi:hypothetical protein
MKPELTNNGPPGAAYTCQEKGWMSHEGFVVWLRHFIAHVKPSKESPVVLILDGHVSHTKNLEAIELARDSGIVMVSLPPHCTHRLQPLDVSFFGPFKRAYDSALRSWQIRHPGRPVTTWQFAELLSPAYAKAATIENAVSGFKASGLWPLNVGIFKETDFAAAYITDQNSDGRPGCLCSQHVHNIHFQLKLTKLRRVLV